MINGKTRSQRIKEHRVQRMKLCADIIEGKVPAENRRVLRRNQVIMFAILIFWGVLYINSFINANPLSVSKDEFISKYEDYVEKYSDKFIYDKGIKQEIKNKTEYSLIQNSSMQTKNLISIYEIGIKNPKLKRVGVIGKYKNTDVFKDSYTENVLLLSSIILDESYEKTRELLKNMKLIDDNYNIIYRKERFLVKYKGKEFIFFAKNDNLIFSIENE